MAYVPCEWYYEHVLGDSCNNNCDECFGDRNIYVCKSSFEVLGDKLEPILIEENSWWELVLINDDDYAWLRGADNRELMLKQDFFDSHFESFIYN